MALENFKLKLDDTFEFKIIHWLLVIIYEEKVTIEKLNAKFIEAVSKGYNIFGVWAIFGLYDFEKFGIHNIIYLMKKNKLYYEKENILYLTRKGEKQYRKALSKEKVRITKEMKKYKNWKAPSRFLKLLWGIISALIIIMFIILIVFIGPIIYNSIIQFL